MEPRRFGVVTFYNPRLMYLKYQPLVDYLSERTGERWDLAISRNYQEAVDALCSGDVVAAYLGPFTYVRAHESCGVEPIVRLNTGGSDTYRSLIMVRQDSPIEALSELRGGRFGFGSPLSTSSHLVPRAMLREAGLEPRDLVCRYYNHHERAARAVLLGEVDACGVRDIVGRKFTSRGLRVIAESDPIPNFPIVLAPRTPPPLRQRLLEAFASFESASPPGEESWDEELAAGFVPVEDRAYEPIRALARELLGPGALELSGRRLQCEPGGS